METVQGTINKILFSNEENGFKVLKIRTPSGSPSVVTGEFGPEIIIDTIAVFHGEWRSHPKYGTNFKCYSYEITFDNSELISIKLFIDCIAPNIGPERADAIISHFGKDTIKVLDETPERLVEVEGIGKVSANSLAKAWTENRNVWSKEREIWSLRSFLNSLGIKERRVKKIINHFGGGLSAEEKIRNNPYILTEVEGFGFSTTDYIAKRLGIPESSPDRLKAFILHMLNVVCPSNGHLYFELKHLAPIANQYCKETNTKFLSKEVLNTEDVKPFVEKLKEDKIVVIDNEFVYANKYYNFEKRSAQMITNIANETSDLIFLTNESIEEHIATFEQEQGIVLSPEQRLVMHHFGEHKVFVITGLPGTGKTTVIKAIVNMAKTKKLRLTCMTPTGISAKKLALTVENKAYTIHRLLGFRGNEWICNELNPYDTDVVIIDESSMIDQEVFYRLLCALKKRVHIIFVGDQNQLPSVGAGNVLKELVNCEVIPVVRLERIFRQDEASDIIKVAHKIKSGDPNLDLFSNDPKSDVFFLRIRDPQEIEKLLINLAQKFKNERRLFQMISPRRDGPLGINPLNTVLQQVLNPPSDNIPEVNCGNFIIRKGDRIIIKRNDYVNDIYNGDIGKVVDVVKGSIYISIDDRIINLTFDEVVEKVRLAYMITVHGSQGQEYPYIILPFINQFGRNMLQRNLLYTAITRAKEKVIILGHGSALEKAINNASVTKRNTRLAERIKQCHQKLKNSTSQSLSKLQDFQNALSQKDAVSPEKIEYFPTATTEN